MITLGIILAAIGIFLDNRLWQLGLLLIIVGAILAFAGSPAY
jgi:hypothetical protein